MPKKKYTFPVWMSAKEDLRELRFIQLGNSLMLHPTTMDLNHTSYRVLTYMFLESKGKREFTFPKSKWRRFISPDGFQKAKKQLIKLGFIEEIENNAHRKKANVYRFKSEWKNYKKTASDGHI